MLLNKIKTKSYSTITRLICATIIIIGLVVISGWILDNVKILNYGYLNQDDLASRIASAIACYA